MFWSFIPLLISSALYSQPKKSTGISQCKRHEKNLDNDVVLGVPCILKSIKDVSCYYFKIPIKTYFKFLLTFPDIMTILVKKKKESSNCCHVLILILFLWQICVFIKKISKQWFKRLVNFIGQWSVLHCCVRLVDLSQFALPFFEVCPFSILEQKKQRDLDGIILKRM